MSSQRVVTAKKRILAVIPDLSRNPMGYVFPYGIAGRARNDETHVLLRKAILT